MRVTLLGTGGPRPDVNRHGTAVAVEAAGELLLFDCGRGVILQLVRAGFPLAKINRLFITHHHYDHIGDLADLIITTWQMGRREPLEILGPHDTCEIVDTLINRVYAKDIRFRSEGEPAHGGWIPVYAKNIGEGLVYESPSIRVFAEFVEHGHGLGIPDFEWYTLGYRIEAEGKVLAISGDTVACRGLDRLAQNADTLIQCCYLASAEITNEHLARVARLTLACADQVGKIAARNNVQRLVLTHFREKSPEMMAQLVKEVRADFDRDLVIAEDLLQLDV